MTPRSPAFDFRFGIFSTYNTFSVSKLQLLAYLGVGIIQNIMLPYLFLWYYLLVLIFLYKKKIILLLGCCNFHLCFCIKNITTGVRSTCDVIPIFYSSHLCHSQDMVTWSWSLWSILLFFQKKKKKTYWPSFQVQVIKSFCQVKDVVLIKCSYLN